ncbi:hypothetical protein [Paraliomyxa miuraensis]|uniref:hypothetical protein n=1 Tax=Paraliomyxa miuraensis TaxID=376150 RepID=UPI00225A6134|nr:hypothetical protein [Paraliomyxa miuraensis]MCX4247538.1 hypothetical protein [Paraliomyxa miuraensis]
MVGSWRPKALVMGLGLGLGACAGRARPLGDPDRFAARECLAAFTLTYEDSPLAELRELGGARAQVQDRFPAAVIDPQRQRPVAATAELRFEGQPIAWWSPMLDAVLLDGAVFAPLRHADATGARPEPRQVVGRVTSRGRQVLGERGVIALLLRVEAIGTYWQLGADLCMTAEHEQGGHYRAELVGVHQVLDDRRVRELDLAFAVELDPEGEIVVVERGAPS